MNFEIITGIILLVTGVLVLMVSQLILRRWMKKYNQEWMGGIEENEMS